MGVLTCDRKGCDNLMCDNISDTYGYLCDSCKSELIDGGRQDIDAFMGKAAPTPYYESSWEDEINAEFKNRWEADDEL